MPTKKILLVENEQQFAFTLRDLLENSGYEVTYVENGKQALSALSNQEKYNLIISDVIMPLMDGFELVREIRKLCYDCKFIAISGGGKIEKEYYLDIISKFGADAILAKPFKYKLLEDIIMALDI